MAFNELSAFTQKVADAADQITGNPAAAKAIFDAAPEELRTAFNNLVKALKFTTSGDSGAKNLGATAISGLTGTDVQSLLESLNTLKANKQQPSWTNITLQNGWKEESSTKTPKYYKDDLGIVRFTGSIYSGTTTNGTVLFTLPEGFRPSTNFAVTTMTWSNTSDYASILLDIWSNGNVAISFINSKQVINLSDISFRAEQ